MKPPPRTLAQAEDWADEGFVLSSVRENGLVLQFATPSLRANKEVVMAAVRQDGLALHYAVKTNNLLLGAAPSLRADKELVMAAVQQSGRALRYADESLRADRDVVMAAVRQTGRALHYAAEHLRADKKVVLAAVQQNGKAFEHASESLRADKDVLRAAVEAGLGALTHVAKPSAALPVPVEVLHDAKRELHKWRTGMLCPSAASGWPMQHASAPTFAIVMGVKKRSVVVARPVATRPRAAALPAKAIPLPRAPPTAKDLEDMTIALADAADLLSDIDAASLLSDDDDLRSLHIPQQSGSSSGGDSNRGSSSNGSLMNPYACVKRKATEAGLKQGSPVAAEATDD